MDANIAIVQQAYGDFGSGNIPALIAAMTGDVVWQEPPGGVAPWAGTHTGHAALTEFFHQLLTQIHPIEFEPREFIAHGDRVIVLGRYKFQAKSTGKSWETDWVMIWTLAHGKISRFQIFKDTGAEIAAFQL